METKENNKEMVRVKMFTIQGEFVLGQNLQGVNYLKKRVEKEFPHGEYKDQTYWLTEFEMSKEMVPEVTEAIFKEMDLMLPVAGDMGDDNYYDFVPDALDQFQQFGYHTGQLDDPDFVDDMTLIWKSKYTYPDGTMDEDEAPRIEGLLEEPYTYGLTWDEI